MIILWFIFKHFRIFRRTHSGRGRRAVKKLFEKKKKCLIIVVSTRPVLCYTHTRMVIPQPIVVLFIKSKIRSVLVATTIHRLAHIIYCYVLFVRDTGTTLHDASVSPQRRRYDTFRRKRARVLVNLPKLMAKRPCFCCIAATFQRAGENFNTESPR